MGSGVGLGGGPAPKLAYKAASDCLLCTTHPSCIPQAAAHPARPPTHLLNSAGRSAHSHTHCSECTRLANASGKSWRSASACSTGGIRGRGVLKGCACKICWASGAILPLTAWLGCCLRPPAAHLSVRVDGLVVPPAVLERRGQVGVGFWRLGLQQQRQTCDTQGLVNGMQLWCIARGVVPLHWWPAHPLPSCHAAPIPPCSPAGTPRARSTGCTPPGGPSASGCPPGCCRQQTGAARAALPHSAEVRWASKGLEWVAGFSGLA